MDLCCSVVVSVFRTFWQNELLNYGTQTDTHVPSAAYNTQNSVVHVQAFHTTSQVAAQPLIRYYIIIQSFAAQ